jgi:hypothetical protein
LGSAISSLNGDATRIISTTNADSILTDSTHKVNSSIRRSELDNILITELLEEQTIYNYTDMFDAESENGDLGGDELEPDDEDDEWSYDSIDHNAYVNYVGATLLHSDETESVESLERSVSVNNYIKESHENLSKSNVIEGLVSTHLSDKNKTDRVGRLNTQVVDKLILKNKKSVYTSQGNMNNFKKGWNYVKHTTNSVVKRNVGTNNMNSINTTSNSSNASRSYSSIFESSNSIEQPPMYINYLAVLKDLINLSNLSTTERVVVDNIDQMINLTNVSVKRSLTDISNALISLFASNVQENGD